MKTMRPSIGCRFVVAVALLGLLGCAVPSQAPEPGAIQVCAIGGAGEEITGGGGRSEIVWIGTEICRRVLDLDPMHVSDVAAIGDGRFVAVGWRDGPPLLGEVVWFQLNREAGTIDIVDRRYGEGWVPTQVAHNALDGLLYLDDWATEGMRVMPDNVPWDKDAPAGWQLPPVVVSGSSVTWLRRYGVHGMGSAVFRPGVYGGWVDRAPRKARNDGMCESLIVPSQGRWVVIKSDVASSPGTNFRGDVYSNEPINTIGGSEELCVMDAGGDGPIEGVWHVTGPEGERAFIPSERIVPGSVLYLSERDGSRASSSWVLVPSRHGRGITDLPSRVYLRVGSAAFAGNSGFRVVVKIESATGHVVDRDSECRVFLLSAVVVGAGQPWQELGDGRRLLANAKAVQGPFECKRDGVASERGGVGKCEVTLRLPIGLDEPFCGEEVVFQVVVEDSAGGLVGVSDIVGTTVLRAEGFPGSSRAAHSHEASSFVEVDSMPSDSAGKKLQDWWGRALAHVKRK